MGLSLAYSSEHKSAPHSHWEPSAEQLRQTRQCIPVGTRVLAQHAVGKVIGYNIAGFGMWMGSIYPLMVELSDGSVIHCRQCDVVPLPTLE